MINKLLRAFVLFLLIISFALAIDDQARIKELATFENIVIDLRGSRGGNGDVAAGYLTSLDMLDRLKYDKPITFIIETEKNGEPGKAAEILAKLTGGPVAKDGQTLRGGKIRIREAGKIPANFPAADLYLSFANPTSDFSQERDFIGRKKTPKNVPVLGNVPINEKTVMITQTVLGNTENKNYTNPYARVRKGVLSKNIATAGVATTEAGIYNDVVAQNLKDKTPKEIRHFLKTEIGHLKDAKVAANLNQLVSSEAPLILVYGTTRTPEVKKQFESYLEGLVTEAGKKQTNFTIVMPSAFSLEDVESPSLREKLEVFTSKDNLSTKGKVGGVRVVTTGALPHRVFVGMIAYSAMPPVVAGDGALSAAMVLGKPFVMTRVAWNAKNVENVGVRMKQSPELTLEQKTVLTTIFPESDKDLDLRDVAKLNEKEMKGAFKNTSIVVSKLTNNIIATAEDAKSWKKPDYAQGISIDKTASMHFELMNVRTKTSLKNLEPLIHKLELMSKEQAEHLCELLIYGRDTKQLSDKDLAVLEKLLIKKLNGVLPFPQTYPLSRTMLKLGMNSEEMAKMIVKNIGNSKFPYDDFLRDEKNIKNILKDKSLTSHTLNWYLRRMEDNYLGEKIIDVFYRELPDQKAFSALSEFVNELISKDIKNKNNGARKVNDLLLEHFEKLSEKATPQQLDELVSRIFNRYKKDPSGLPREFSARFRALYQARPLPIPIPRSGPFDFFIDETITEKLSSEQKDALILKILNEESILTTDMVKTIKRLNGGRPLSKQMIGSFKAYLERLDAKDSEKAFRANLLKGAGVEEVYWKIGKTTTSDSIRISAFTNLRGAGFANNPKIIKDISDHLSSPIAKNISWMLIHMKGNFPEELAMALEKAIPLQTDPSIKENMEEGLKLYKENIVNVSNTKINGGCVLSVLKGLGN